MIKQIIVTITALVLMNSVINFVMADEPIYEADYYGSNDCACFIPDKTIYQDKQKVEGWWDEEFKNHSQIGYDDTQKVNDTNEKDMVISFNHGLGYYNDETFETKEISVDDRENWWQWY